MSDRGEASDVPAHEPAECFSLGFAELGKLLGDMRHRAVVLAQLLGQHRYPGRSRSNARCIAVVAQRDSQQTEPNGGIVVDCHSGCIPTFKFGDARPSEFEYRVVAVPVTEKPQGTERNVVVRLIKGIAAIRGQRIRLGGASSTRGGDGPKRRSVGCDGKSIVDEAIEMAPHHRRCQVKPARELGGGGRPLLEQGASHARRTGRGEFHNSIVAYFIGDATRGVSVPLRGLPRIGP